MHYLQVLFQANAYLVELYLVVSSQPINLAWSTTFDIRFGNSVHSDQPCILFLTLLFFTLHWYIWTTFLGRLKILFSPYFTNFRSALVFSHCISLTAPQTLIGSVSCLVHLPQNHQQSNWIISATASINWTLSSVYATRSRNPQTPDNHDLLDSQWWAHVNHSQPTKFRK